ncbi:hypothetical protein RN001_011047 [Aquatica leii]|uniref:C2H2-type domain-containing protein n=1 Tax=Aquatica leii TaxID=1421715 RepID=A0AAN7PAU0_9COLE|nr:hypothetical protein RN001_011047 [Aquatica leii]
MGENTSTCRMCLQEIMETEQYYFLNNDLNLQFKLLDVLPRINLNITSNPIICNQCTITIGEIHQFKKLCMQTETTVKKINQQMPFNNVLCYVKNETVKEELVGDNVKIELSDLQIKSDVLVCIEDSSKTGLYYCHHCDFNTKKKTELVRHLEIHNNKLQLRIYPGETTQKNLKKYKIINIFGKSFVCEICGFSTQNKSYLKKHIGLHSSGKQFVCEICGFSTRYQSSLNKHLDIHSLDKPFVCDSCGYSTQRKCTLRRHMIIHSLVKPFVCGICEFSTHNRWILKTHMFIHSSDKPFVCEICGYSARQHSNLKKHMISHSLKKPFVCVSCGFSTCYQ